MIRSRVTLGDTVVLNWLIEDAGAGVTGAAARTALKIQRLSDGKLYDFDDDTWQASPVDVDTTLTENTDLLGVYYYDLDTSTLSAADILLVHMSCGSSPADTEVFEIEVATPEDYRAAGVISHDYDSGITYMGAMLLDEHGGIETSTDRAVFRIVNASDGTVLLDDQQILVDVDGIFSHSQGSLGLAAHTAYLLIVAVDFDDTSYYHVEPFTVL